MQSMKHALTTGLAALALATLTVPVAEAGSTAPAAPAAAAAAAPDGFLYAWEHAHAGGAHCKWNADNANWAGCSDKVSDVWNNGFPGRREDVRLYNGREWTESWVCLHQGHSIPDLGASGLKWFGSGHGQGTSVNDSISSHTWVDAC
ncbi:peptidase inhibitor family I36 protein [Streptomyces zhihengii]